MPCLLLLIFFWSIAPAPAEGFLCAGSQGTPTEQTFPAGGAAKPARIAASTTGTRRALVIFARFKGEDTPLPSWAADLFNPKLPGSFSHFYDTMSFGKLQVRGEVAPRVYESSQPAPAYLAGDSSEQGQFGQFSQEVLRQADQDIDFAQFDDDGPDGIPNSGDDDGVVDALFIVVDSTPRGFLLGAATGIADLGFEEPYETGDPGKSGGPVYIAPGQGTIQQGRSFAEATGSMCHEYGHLLGLPDLYNTAFLRQKGAGPEEDGAGVGAWCLMGWGASGWNGDDGPNSFCAWSRMQLGWAQVREPTSAAQEIELEEVGQGGQTCKIPLTNREFFLLEYRRREDDYYNRHVPGQGVLIWHVERQLTERERFFGEQLEPDEVLLQVGVDLKCADGKWLDAGYPEGRQPDSRQGGDNLDFWAHDEPYRQEHEGNLGDETDPFDGARFRDFTPQTNPDSYSGDGKRSVRIEGIRLAGNRAYAQVQTSPLLIEVEGVSPQPMLAGQEQTIPFRLHNRGGMPATAVQVVLSSRDSLVEILQAETRFQELAIDQSSALRPAGGYPRLRFKEQFSGTHRASLSLDIYANGGLVEQVPLSIGAASVRQRLSGMVVIDTSGNRDGKAQPGEFIRVAPELEEAAPELLPLLNFGLRALDGQVLSTTRPELTFDPQSGQAARAPEFLLPAALAPGTILPFEFEVRDELGTWADTLFVEVGAGPDQTPPRVSVPVVTYQDTDLRISLPARLVLDGSGLRAAAALVYSGADTALLASIPLTLVQGWFEGIWPKPGSGVYQVLGQVEDSLGNRGQSAFRTIQIHAPQEAAGDSAVVRLGRGEVDQVAYSPDGRLLAVASSVGIWLHEAATLRQIGLLGADEGRVRALAFSPDNRLLASAGEGEGSVRLWDLAELREVATLKSASPELASSPFWVYALAFSPDGRFLAAGRSDHAAQVWEVEGGVEIAVLRGHTGAVTALAFSPDGRWLATGSADQTIGLWQAGDWTEAGVLKGHRQALQRVEFSPDSRLLISAGAREAGVAIWDLAQKVAVARLNTGAVSAMALDPAGQILAVGAERGVQLWDLELRRQTAAIAEGSAFSALAFSPDGRMLAALGWDLETPAVYALGLWEVATRQRRATLDGYTGPVRSLAFSPDGHFLAAGYQEAAVRLWDTALRQEVGLLGGQGAAGGGRAGVRALNYSPDGRLLASGDGEGKVRLWEVEKEAPLGILAGKGEVQALAYSPDGQLVATAQKKAVHLWDVALQEEIESFQTSLGQANALAFSPDSRVLAIGGAEKVVLWDLDSRQELALFAGRTTPGRLLAFSPDGRVLAVGISYPKPQVRLWDVVTEQDAGVLQDEGTSLHAIALSPDGRLLATGVNAENQGEIHLWQMESLRRVKVLENRAKNLDALEFSPDGRYLASGSEDGTVRLWGAALFAAEAPESALPQHFFLEPNYPNPFNPTTTIRFSLPQAGEAELSIYNLLGQRVATLVHGAQEAGTQVVQWNGRDAQGRELASGVYLYRLQAGSLAETRKLLLLR